MAWGVVPGSSGVWEYDNAANTSLSDTYEEANGTVTGGIRTFTPTGGSAQYTYIRCRKTGETIVRGELNKNYYDGKI